MKAAIVASALKDHGIPVQSVQEGSKIEDGEVQVTEMVSVQVSTYGKKVTVVSFTNGKLTFRPTRNIITEIDEFISDIRKACGMVAA